MKTEDWFKLKKYPHIDLPITIRDYLWVREYVMDNSKVKSHSFLPFIHKPIIQRKYRKIKNFSDGKGLREKKLKHRDIYFSSHLDSMIYSYYNKNLLKSYDDYLKSVDFNDSIVAYRKIPKRGVTNGNKCNIDFAKSVFEFIKDQGNDNLIVIVADITSFFDNLDHKILKRQWCKILGEKSLPKDHYNLFKSLTRIKYVKSRELFDSYDKTMIVERGKPNDAKLTEYKRIKINCHYYFKEKKAVSYCSKVEFFGNNLKLIKFKKNTLGIPQGTPISATLANIYMLDFDQTIYTKIKDLGGFYQRYSDDIIIVVDKSQKSDVINFLRECVSDTDIAGLQIHKDKTKIYNFERNDDDLIGYEINEDNDVPNYNKTLEYLGFAYNGKKVLIKTSGYSKFYRSMKKSFKKSASLARYSKNPDKRLFKSRLYKRFTHKGAKRKLIYRPSINDSKKYIRTKEYDWGNYLSYVFKANEEMKDLDPENSIKKQSRRVWKNFHVLMDKYSKT